MHDRTGASRSWWRVLGGKGLGRAIEENLPIFPASADRSEGDLGNLGKLDVCVCVFLQTSKL